MKSVDQQLRLSAVQSLSKPQRPKSKSLQPCQCEYKGCGKMFSKRSNLKAHMRVHNGVLPYPCIYPGCAKRFRWKSSLKPHIKVHEGSDQIKTTTTSTSSVTYSANTNLTPVMDTIQTPTSKEVKKSIHQVFCKQPTYGSCLTPLPLNHITSDSNASREHSPTAIMDSHIFESPTRSQIVPIRNSSTIYSPNFRVPTVIDFQGDNSVVDTELKPSVARVLFPEALSTEAELSSMAETNPSCNSNLSNSQTSCETELEDDSINIANDLWKTEPQVIDPFIDISTGFMNGSKGIDLFSSSICTPGLFSSNSEIYQTTDSHWSLPIEGVPSSSADITGAFQFNKFDC